MKTWKTKSGYKIIQVLSGRSNVFLLSNGIENILIDTSPKCKWNKLVKRLDSLKINKIDYLILTHTHYDHAGNSNSIKLKYKSAIIVHKKEASYLTSGENIIPNGTNIFTRILLKLFAEKVFPKLKYEACKYDFLVDSIFILKDFGFNAYIIHTPGHTPGSMSIIIDNEIAIVGDAMFGVFKWSIFPPFANDINELINSWGKLLANNCSIFLPSHGSQIKRFIVKKNFFNRIRFNQ